MNQQEYEINLKDLLAEVLLRWKILAIAAVIGAACGAGYATYKNRDVAAQVAANADRDAVTEAADALSEMQITKLEGMYQQYMTALELRQTLSEYIADALSTEPDAEDEATSQLLTALESVSAQLESIENVEIPNLSDNETAYYNALTGKNIIEDPTPLSVAKYGLLGLVGLPIAVAALLVLWIILAEHKARSISDIEHATGISTLAVFDQRGASCKDPIRRFAMRLQNGDRAIEDMTAYQSILQERVQELLQQHDDSRLYIADGAEPMLEGWSDYAAAGGCPEVSAEAMQDFLRSDSVVLVTRMYETEMAALLNTVHLCEAHDKRILGNIVVYGTDR